MIITKKELQTLWAGFVDGLDDSWSTKIVLRRSYAGVHKGKLYACYVGERDEEICITDMEREETK